MHKTGHFLVALRAAALSGATRTGQAARPEATSAAGGEPRHPTTIR